MGAPCSTSSSHVGGGGGRHRAGTQTGGTGISSPRNERGLYRAHVLSNALPASAAEPAHPSQGRFRNRLHSAVTTVEPLPPLPGSSPRPPSQPPAPSARSIPTQLPEGPKRVWIRPGPPLAPGRAALGDPALPSAHAPASPQGPGSTAQAQPRSLLPALGDCALTPSPRDPPLPASPLTAFPHSP